MDPKDKFKVKLECQLCKEEFRIAFNHFIEKKQIDCPNCNNEFPQEALEFMQNGLSSFKSAVQELRLNKDDKTDCAWKFAIDLNYITNL